MHMQCFALQVINTKESEYIFWLYQMDYCFKDINKFYMLGMLQGLHPSQPDCGSFSTGSVQVKKECQSTLLGVDNHTLLGVDTQAKQCEQPMD